MSLYRIWYQRRKVVTESCYVDREFRASGEAETYAQQLRRQGIEAILAAADGRLEEDDPQDRFGPLEVWDVEEIE